MFHAWRNGLESAREVVKVIEKKRKIERMKKIEKELKIDRYSNRWGRELSYVIEVKE